jgi:S1-C subfamily serine protease
MKKKLTNTSAKRLYTNISSYQATSNKWRATSLFLISIILINIGFFAHNYLDLQTQFTDLQSQYSEIQEQLLDNQQELQQLQQKIEITNSVNQSNNSLIPKIFNLLKDSVVLIKTKVQTTTELQDKAQGSGFIYDQNGHIITNYHVIEGADEISVTFTSGNVTTATIIGTDPYSDIAIIKAFSPYETFRPVVLGNSSALIVGEQVAAIGNPFGLSGTITAGIISQIGRDLSAPGGYRIVDVIQLDAAINPGNSGGPLVNMWGEVVGMNTAIISDSIGVGFAIPSDTIMRELPSLLATGHYLHPWLGITGYDVDPDIANNIGLNSTDGIFISEVIVGSPADSSGLKSNDVIVGLDELRIRNFNDLSVYLERNTQPGDTITVIVIRNQQKLLRQVVLGERPPP